MSHSTVCASDLGRWPSAFSSVRRKGIHGVPSQHYVRAPLGCEEAFPVPRAASAGGVVRASVNGHTALDVARGRGEDEALRVIFEGLVSGWDW
jgi:hypothetical protein